MAEQKAFNNGDLLKPVTDLVSDFFSAQNLVGDLVLSRYEHDTDNRIWA